MKITWRSLLVAGISMLAAVAHHEGRADNISPAAAASSSSTCIEAHRIDRTERPDDSTIIFHMIDGSVWKNTLPDRCVGLRSDPKGFTFEAIPGRNVLCSNLGTIRLNDSGSVCMLGAFSPVKPAS